MKRTTVRTVPLAAAFVALWLSVGALACSSRAPHAVSSSATRAALNTPRWRSGGAPPPVRYEPRALAEIERRAKAESAAGRTPVVVFDLDHTLIDNRPRTLHILRQWAATRPTDDAVRAVGSLTVDRIYYDVASTLRAAGLNDPETIQAADKAWSQKFFANEYISDDRPVDGAVDFMKRLRGAGATVVYLTGRDAPGMEAGTRRNLMALGFPLDDDKARLMMKPRKEMSDKEFKRAVAGDIARLGTVVVAAENEPVNLTCMCCDWPEATLLYLDTDHRPADDNKLPPGHAKWVKDFTGR